MDLKLLPLSLRLKTNEYELNSIHALKGYEQRTD